MKPEWYGDKRDLIKWTVLFETAKKHDISHILWVVYYSESEYETIKIGTDEYNLSDEVKDAFRGMTAIAKVVSFRGHKISIVSLFEPFSINRRDEYHNDVLEKMKRMPTPHILFLDPDTGIMTKKARKASEKHVGHDEISKLWGNMSRNSILVVYQHGHRQKDRAWVGSQKEQLAECIKVDMNKILIGESDMAKDVAFYIVSK